MISVRAGILTISVVFAVAVAFGLGILFGPSVRPAAGGPAVAPSQVAGGQPAKASPAPVDYVGSFRLAPARGPIGSRVTARGAGFDPNADLELVWQAFAGEWKTDDTPENYKGREYREQLVPLGSVRTDGAGAFTATFTVPDGFGFGHDVRVIQDGTVKNQSAFMVEMRVNVSPRSGPVGTPITIEVEGIGVSPLHSSWELTYDNQFTGWISAVTTQGRAKAVIPATGAVGPHVLKVLHGSFTFPYMNMQQSPDPTRPTFTEIFTITEGEAVLPPTTAEQAPPTVAGESPSGGTGPVAWTDPQEGPIETSSILHASGLAPGTDFSVAWQTQVGVDTQMIGGSGDERPQADWELGTVRSDASGTVDWQFTVPEDKGGDHRIELRRGEEVVASATFRIRPSARPLDVSRGPVGTEMTINLKGIDDTDTGKIFMLVYDNSMLGYACSVTSQGDITIYLPAAGEPGWHFIDLYPGIYKGEDLPGVYNYRIPQLTYAADHPGESLTVFRFAFEVTAGDAE